VTYEHEIDAAESFTPLTCTTGQSRQPARTVRRTYWRALLVVLAGEHDFFGLVPRGCANALEGTRETPGRVPDRVLGTQNADGARTTAGEPKVSAPPHSDAAAWLRFGTQLPAYALRRAMSGKAVIAIPATEVAIRDAQPERNSPRTPVNG